MTQDTYSSWPAVSRISSWHFSLSTSIIFPACRSNPRLKAYLRTIIRTVRVGCRRIVFFYEVSVHEHLGQCRFTSTTRTNDYHFVLRVIVALLARHVCRGCCAVAIQCGQKAQWPLRQMPLTPTDLLFSNIFKRGI